MDGARVRGVGCTFFQCQAVQSGPQFHHCVLDLLGQIGMVFHTADPFPSPVDPDPKRHLDSTGRLLRTIAAIHPLLQPINPEWNRTGDFVGRYEPENIGGTFTIGNANFLGATDHDPVLSDMGRSRLEFLRLVIPLVKPRWRVLTMGAAFRMSPAK